MLEAQEFTVNKETFMGEHARFLNACQMMKYSPLQNTSPLRKQGTESFSESLACARACIRDLREFVAAVLGWEAEDLIGRCPLVRCYTATRRSWKSCATVQRGRCVRRIAVPVFKPERRSDPGSS